MNMHNPIPQEIFRAYDIRGIVDEQLTPQLLSLLGKSYAQEMRARELNSIAVGYDGRLSSLALSQGLIEGLSSGGIDVTNIGMVPTPCLYFAVSELNKDAGIMITGSHNPKNYNGCKMLMGGESVALELIQQLYKNIIANNFPVAVKQGQLSEEEFLPRYIECLTRDVKLSKSYQLIVDSGNGVTGICAPEVYRKLGCEVTELYCEVDGNFPNHHPDPNQLENLLDIKNKISELNADVGFAFDGDGDRMGLIAEDGEIIYPDRVMMLLAEDLLQRHPGAPIIFDVKCSSLLARIIKEKGGEPIMWNTGHSLIKKKMKETNSLLAGEMSGHLFFAENWPLSDDALLAGVRLLQIMDKQNASFKSIFAAYPNRLSTPEINLTSQEATKFQIIEQLCNNKHKFAAQQIIDIDGLRAEYEDGWGLIRASNTSPLLVLRFEADNNVALNRIIDKFVEELNKQATGLDLSSLVAAKVQ